MLVDYVEFINKRNFKKQLVEIDVLGGDSRECVDHLMVVEDTYYPQT